MKHPMQPIGLDDGDVPRFKANAIVKWLFDTDKINLNEIVYKEGFSPEDLAQFWQLLGYSVSGYGDLSFIPQEITDEADRIAAELVAAKKRPR